MNLLLWIFQSTLGCHHGRLSRVFTIHHRTYRVYLDCGREFGYSWELMRSLHSGVVDDVNPLPVGTS